MLVGRVSAGRSRTMAAIRSKDTKAELALRKALTALGLRYRLHKKDLPGRPDIVFPSIRLALFCDGDFWHGRGWQQRKAQGFRVREAYWVQKIESNINRDRKNVRDLRAHGWAVMRVWETDVLRDPARVAQKVLRRVQTLRSDPPVWHRPKHRPV